MAAERAYAMARIGPKEISFAELHDAFVILELAISEEVGLFERGKALVAGETRLEGRSPSTPPAGLRPRHTPVGATGVCQVFELTKQLRGDAKKEERQVKDPRHGLAVNFGGFGNNVVATICSKEPTW
jgi:acetyl-CoA C-acetyltransferase